ncbi:DUF4350 domain-containing protein [Phormidium sp. CCY1219]|uniref:DUF4350 domain-containing protein n=1 Tax=Phormidium sp. CCY1219 TaxID=2886104 RepID=UPI002D1EDF68|nr:DUF4350 domain-containing protein [Phormidium sp. CCY1219]MEB3831034.1 DUF4350 domain-containing protein [Phormidium sp. CCY1219]
MTSNISSRRLWVFGAIAVAAIAIFTFLGAPASSQYNSGSTYGRDPDGYGAWYAYMERQNIPIERWQKPFEKLSDRHSNGRETLLLRVYRNLRVSSLSQTETEWVKKGNTLVMLGIMTPATKAPFVTRQNSPVGEIKIATRRRQTRRETQLLGDEFGAIVWETTIGEGKVIFASTRHLAANAYQNEPGNYPFLAQLVATGDRPILVDEYIHGYRDPEVLEEQQTATLTDYLAKTPVFPVLVQALILLLILISAKNRRFGQIETLPTPQINNSQAYIEALAGVLQKAGTRDFVIHRLGKEEQRQLQQALGLGQVPVEPEILANAWAQQTGRPAADILQQLQTASHPGKLSDSELLGWVKKWSSIRNRFFS